MDLLPEKAYFRDQDFVATPTISPHRWSPWMSFTRIAVALLSTGFALLPAMAQSPESYRGMLTARVRSNQLPPPGHLKDYIQDGKLSLGLRDAILLTLENNSNVQIDETQVESQKFNLLSQFSPFDPSLQSSLIINRYSTLGYSQLQGVGVSTNAISNSLSQTGQVTYTQTFSPGTNIQAAISTNKSSSNNS
jgi:outer membrane protein TolC